MSDTIITTDTTTTDRADRADRARAHVTRISAIQEVAEALADAHCADVAAQGYCDPTPRDARDFCRGTLADAARDAGLVGDDEDVSEIRAGIARAITRWREGRREERLEAAVAYLQAAEVEIAGERWFLYRDDATGDCYVSTEGAMVDLGADLELPRRRAAGEDGRPRSEADAYSHWCSIPGSGEEAPAWLVEQEGDWL